MFKAAVLRTKNKTLIKYVSRMNSALLHYAVERVTDPEILKLIIGNSKDINKLSSKGSTALAIAVAANNVTAINLLLSHRGIRTDVRDFSNATPVHNAVILACEGKPEALEALLRHNGFINLYEELTAYGTTPIQIAIKNKNLSVVKLLLNSGKLNVAVASTDVSETPLESALCDGSQEIVSCILESGKGKLDIFQTLLSCSQKPSVDIEKCVDWLCACPTFNINAIKNGFSLFCNVILLGDIKLIKAFLKQPTLDLHASNFDNTTREPSYLTLATKHCSEAIPEILNDPSVDINQRDLKGNTAIMYALKKRNLGLFKDLLNPKIDWQKFIAKYKAMINPMEFTQAGLQELFARSKVNLTIPNHKGHTPISKIKGLIAKDDRIEILQAVIYYAADNPSAKELFDFLEAKEQKALQQIVGNNLVKTAQLMFSKPSKLNDFPADVTKRITDFWLGSEHNFCRKLQDSIYKNLSPTTRKLAVS